MRFPILISTVNNTTGPKQLLEFIKILKERKLNWNFVYRYRTGVFEQVARSIVIWRDERCGRAGGVRSPPPTSVSSVTSCREAARVVLQIRTVRAATLNSDSTTKIVLRKMHIGLQWNLHLWMQWTDCLIGLQCFLWILNLKPLPNWGCIRWSSVTAYTPLSV